MRLQSKSLATLITYATILFNTLSNIVLTPLYLGHFGQETYGLYQMIYSVASYILVLDLGISTTMVRFVSEYRLKKQKQEEENFAAICLLILTISAAAVMLIGFYLNSRLLDIFPSISPEEENIAHRMFVLMFVTIAFTLVEHYLSGIVMAHEHFVVVKILGLLKIVLKVSLVIALLVLGFGVLSIVYSDIFVIVFLVVFYLYYAFVKLKFKIHLYRLEKSLVLMILTFMLSILLQSVVQFVNNTVDKTILGILMTKTDVAVYSIALTFITIFSSLPSCFVNLFLPQATRLIVEGASREQLTMFVVRPGRYQFMICGGILSGFILFGREFIDLWVGNESEGAWLVAVIIMVPTMVFQITSTAVPILDAKKKRIIRSLILLALSAVNIVLTIFLVKKIGMLGAPIGTGISYVIGYGILLNIYYDKVIDIDVLKMYRCTLSRTWLCLLIVSFICIPINQVFAEISWLTLFIKVLIFCALYFVFMLLFGFNEEEKRDLLRLVNSIKLFLGREKTATQRRKINQ